MNKNICFGIIFILIICLSCVGEFNLTQWKDFFSYNHRTEDMREKLDNDIYDTELMSILNNYQEFKETLKSAKIDIPVKNNFIPQGLTLMEDYYIIIGYYGNKQKSQCYIINQDNLIINVVTLDTNAHVGGIYYDTLLNLIWLPDNKGFLNIYRARDFLTKKKVKAIYKYKNLSDELVDYTNENKNMIAFLTIHNAYLYIGNFHDKKSCVIKKYKIIITAHKIKLEYVNKFMLPQKIQGITFYSKNDKTYLITSSSYNRKNKSNIYIYLYDDTIFVNELFIV